MMWWAADGSWARGWSWAAILIMAGVMVMCMTMMSRMGLRMGGPRPWHDDRPGRGDPERTLATRLASGEIDVDEYERLLGVLQRTGTRRDHEEV